VSARERALETRRIIRVANHHLRAGGGQSTRLVGSGRACDRAHREPPFRVGEDGAHEVPALGSGGANDGNRFGIGHV